MTRLQHYCCKKMLQEILKVLGMLQTAMLQNFQSKKECCKSHVAKILGDTAMLQTPNVAKKKPMGGGALRCVEW